MRASSLACCLMSLLALVSAGCSMSGDVEALEAQLRRQEDRVRRLEHRLKSAEVAARGAREEAALLRAQLEDPASVPRAEQIAVGLALKSVRFHKMLSAVVDDGGGRRLHLVFQPVDGDGDLIKVTGVVEFRVLDLSGRADDQELGAWQYDERETRALWRSSAIGSGFVADLPIPPDFDATELVLHGRLVTADGRQFDASHTVRL